MKPSKFSQLSGQEQNWLDDYLDGTIGQDEFSAMQDHMIQSSAFRKVMRRYLSIDHSLEVFSGETEEISPWAQPLSTQVKAPIFRLASLLPIAAAAALAFFLGSLFTKDSAPEDVIATPERSAEGFAVVSALFDAVWRDDKSSRQPGDTLSAEVFTLASGTAEIQFFSGAYMTVEGPAEILLKSAWEAECRNGAVRMKVPPAARGFKLQAPSAEIVDLGTEFGLSVRGGHGEIEVFDGEISVQGRGGKEQFFEKGNAVTVLPSGTVADSQSGIIKFPDARHLKPEADSGRERWQTHRDTLSRDPRLIAYYTFEKNKSQALIPNLAMPRNTDLDGAVILAESATGRWPNVQSALEFRRPGSRVRVNLPGEFPALTFMTWVRIDSLDRQYNALFMGDGYENGEPHWQICDDGKMMLSVMVDDSKQHPQHAKSRFHHVYFSPPIWNLSMSGQWMHLASVYDPAKELVSHFVNGKQISREAIKPDFNVKTLRIGNGEIGNWGQPFREDPSFAIRNLNGRMDEIAIFHEALTEKAIAKLFEESRSNRSH